MDVFKYNENFGDGELHAWASYPPCQDTAYDPYIYPGKILPGDEYTCLVAVNYPPWNEDQLLGAVKLLECFLDEECSIRFRYYIKTLDYCPRLEIHLPLTTGERLLYSVTGPYVNCWNELCIGWQDLAEQNELLLSVDRVKISAVAVQVKIKNADPEIPVFFGLGEVHLTGKIEPCFTFIKPEVVALTEWHERIPLKHYHSGDELTIEGTYDCKPAFVCLEITPFTIRDKVICSEKLTFSDKRTWKSVIISLERERFPSGLYHGTITATAGPDGTAFSTTLFTFCVAPANTGGRHPMLYYDDESFAAVKVRMASSRFSSVREKFLREGQKRRENLNPSEISYDFDQFPAQDWIATLRAWNHDRIMNYREALYFNAVAYSLCDDHTAGQYCRDLLLVIAQFPQWNHPWMENRGIHIYLPLGEFADVFALAYDLTYGLMSCEERQTVRQGLVSNYIIPAFNTYVEQNQITGNSSNWISHIAGGALVALSSIYGDDPELGCLEPWFTGFILKEYRYITTVFGSDGSYGEGYRYYNYAMQSLGKALPVLDRVFGIDLSYPVHNSYLETLWAGIVCENRAFTFGDSVNYLKAESQAIWIGSENGPMNNWAWLLYRTGDNLLSWFYHQLKEFDTFQEVLYETDEISEVDPDILGNVRFFREVGTAVFRSGWGANDFVFVFRCGPFYNHQHLDQGSFYLSDHGRIFLEERYDGEHHYYDDPVYRSHAIQPISHNTLLINRNPQSQKVGDPAGFAPGMNDQAVFSGCFDSLHFAYVSGDLERIYMERVKILKRHVVFIKPRIILLVDEIVPDNNEVEINELFHSQWKKDISLYSGFTTFRKDSSTLYMYHLTPDGMQREILTEPHFKCQYDTRPLIERGYLQCSSKTGALGLTMAHLMTATADGSTPDITVSRGDSGIDGTIAADGNSIWFTVNSSGISVERYGYTSDALIMAGVEGTSGVFIVSGHYIESDGKVISRSETPMVTYHTMQFD